MKVLILVVGTDLTLQVSVTGAWSSYHFEAGLVAGLGVEGEGSEEFAGVGGDDVDVEAACGEIDAQVHDG